MHSFKQAVVLPWGIKKLKQPKSFDKMEEFVQMVRKLFANFILKRFILDYETSSFEECFSFIQFFSK